MSSRPRPPVSPVVTDPYDGGCACPPSFTPPSPSFHHSPSPSSAMLDPSRATAAVAAILRLYASRPRPPPTLVVIRSCERGEGRAAGPGERAREPDDPRRRRGVGQYEPLAPSARSAATPDGGCVGATAQLGRERFTMNVEREGEGLGRGDRRVCRRGEQARRVDPRRRLGPRRLAEALHARHVEDTSPGPGAYSPEVANRHASTKSGDFGATAGPGAYALGDTISTQAVSERPSSPRYIFSRTPRLRHAAPEFISADHSRTDRAGFESPGPGAYLASDAFAAHHRTMPRQVIGRATRERAARAFISKKHIDKGADPDTPFLPGPASYFPKIEGDHLWGHTPHAVMGTARKGVPGNEDKLFVSKELVKARFGAESPGPIYLPATGLSDLARLRSEREHGVKPGTFGTDDRMKLGPTARDLAAVPGPGAYDDFLSASIGAAVARTKAAEDTLTYGIPESPVKASRPSSARPTSARPAASSTRGGGAEDDARPKTARSGVGSLRAGAQGFGMSELVGASPTRGRRSPAFSFGTSTREHPFLLVGDGFEKRMRSSAKYGTTSTERR